MTTDTEPEVSLLPATIEQAQAVWESMEKPSARKVEAELKTRGLYTTYRTINRWKARRWEANPGSLAREQKPPRPKPVERAIRERVAKLTPRQQEVAEGGLMKALASPINPDEVKSIDDEMLGLIGDQTNMPLAELQERTRMALNVVLMRRAAAKADLLVMIPKDMAAFVLSMTDASKPVSMSIPAPAAGGDPGKMIDVTPTSNPLSDAIAQFKRRTGVAA